MLRLEKVGRTGGLFGELFSRPLYKTLDAFEVDGVTVPAGYLTDLVSAPWWARPFMPLRRMKLAAIKHDWRRKNQRHMSLQHIDDLFEMDLDTDGLSQPWRFVVRFAVGLNKNR